MESTDTVKPLPIELIRGESILYRASTVQVAPGHSGMEISRRGDYVPFNGLKMVGVESLTLCVTFLIAILSYRLRRRPWERPRWLSWILASNRRSVLAVFVLALISRAILLPVIGVPEPRINDEYSYLLMADTFSHHRLTNPTPPEWQHFETFWVNFTPTYHSKYPVSQGIVLALGETVFHQPWVGVYLSTAALCAAICWALQAFFPPLWALLGACLAILRVAIFSYWMNSYWGGSVAALGGALALGCVVRTFDKDRTDRSRLLLTCLFAVSMLILATSRPFEGLAFSIPLLAYYAWNLVRSLSRGEVTFRSTLLPAGLIVLSGALMMGYYNERTTGNPLLLPHVLNERTYSPLPLFLWQSGKSTFKFADPAFAKFYEVLAQEFHYRETKSAGGLKDIEISRFLQAWFFYIGPALSLPILIGLIAGLRQARTRLVVLAAFCTAIAFALSFYTMMHYAAPGAICVYLLAIEGLRYMWLQQHTAERSFVVAVCATVVITCLARQTGAAAKITFAYPNNRRLITQDLENKPGRHLVLVAYDLEHHYPGEELVHNGADFSSERILWARSKGLDNDRQLCAAYAGRTFWMVTTDDESFSLKPINLCEQPRLRP